MPTPHITDHPALAELTAEQRAPLADPQVAARFAEFMAEAFAKPGKGRWWGATSADHYLRVSAMVGHAAYTVGLERRRAELAVVGRRAA